MALSRDCLQAKYEEVELKIRVSVESDIEDVLAGKQPSQSGVVNQLVHERNILEAAIERLRP